MPELGVNIDHVATIRQARRTYEPDPVWAAAEAELGGADGITVHLREDRRHIQDRDVELLRKTVSVKLNLEMACSAEIVAIACRIKPDQATLVPERREEVTTEGGLDVVGQRAAVETAIKQIARRGNLCQPVSRSRSAATRFGEIAGRRGGRIAHRQVCAGKLEKSRSRIAKFSPMPASESATPAWPCTPAMA